MNFMHKEKIFTALALAVCMSACTNTANEPLPPAAEAVEAVVEETAATEETQNSMTESASTESEATEETAETEITDIPETEEVSEEQPAESSETTAETTTEAAAEELTEPETSAEESQVSTDETAAAQKEISDYLYLTPSDLFKDFGENYTAEYINSAGIKFEDIPYVFWVDYDYDTKDIIPDGTIHAIDALSGATLNYNITIGKTHIDEFEALTNGKYTSADAEEDDSSEDTMIIINENGFTTWYYIDENGTVKSARVKISY